jgi:hypothetical protein
MSMAHARQVIAEWRRDYNEARPKRIWAACRRPLRSAPEFARNSGAKESSTVAVMGANSDCYKKRDHAAVWLWLRTLTQLLAPPGLRGWYLGIDAIVAQGVRTFSGVGVRLAG